MVVTHYLFLYGDGYKQKGKKYVNFEREHNKFAYIRFARISLAHQSAWTYILGAQNKERKRPDEKPYMSLKGYSSINKISGDFLKAFCRFFHTYTS